jgi:hypothetical protein
MPVEDSGDRVGSTPQQQTTMQSPREPLTNQHIPPTPANDQTNKSQSATEKLERDIRTGEWWLIGIGIVGLILNVVIAKIYYGQLVEMREATRATKDAVKVARDTLNESRASSAQARIDSKADSIASDKRAHDALQATIDQFTQDQRPWVSLTGFRVQLSPKAALIPNLSTTDEAIAEFQNSGHTPARDVQGALGFGFKDRKHIMNGEDERWMAEQLDIQRRGFGGRKDWWLKLPSEGISSYRPWGKLVMGSVILEPISLGVVGPGSTIIYRRNDDWHAGTGIPYDAFFFGELTYRDSSNATHNTRFCVYRPENVGDIFDACPVFNGMD